MNRITEFRGRYTFLSNFYPCGVTFDGEEYPTVEHAFQAAKTDDPELRRDIACADTAGVAKRLGRKVPLRPDWETVKIGIMRGLLEQKFSGTLGDELLMTGEAELVEGNWWGDTFWGVYRGEGQNWLGRLLMELRRDLRIGIGLEAK